MTGILPIKKYGTHSALNMFDEFSMIDPGPLAEYVGFTEGEVRALCDAYGMDMQEVKSWYDGYSFEKAPSIYSPCSVVSCMRFGKIGNYWNQTETFEALKVYIDMNFEGFRHDVLTLLIHLGYLAYDYDHKTVKIPNSEVRAICKQRIGIGLGRDLESVKEFRRHLKRDLAETSGTGCRRNAAGAF